MPRKIESPSQRALEAAAAFQRENPLATWEDRVLYAKAWHDGYKQARAEHCNGKDVRQLDMFHGDEFP